MTDVINVMCITHCYILHVIEIIIFKETLTKQSFVQLCVVYTEAIKIIQWKALEVLLFTCFLCFGFRNDYQSKEEELNQEM